MSRYGLPMLALVLLGAAMHMAAAATCTIKPADLSAVVWKPAKAGCATVNSNSTCKTCICGIGNAIAAGLTAKNVTVNGKPATDPTIRTTLLNDCLLDLTPVLTNTSGANMTNEVASIVGNCDYTAIANTCTINGTTINGTKVSNSTPTPAPAPGVTPTTPTPSPAAKNGFVAVAAGTWLLLVAALLPAVVLV